MLLQAEVLGRSCLKEIGSSRLSSELRARMLRGSETISLCCERCLSQCLWHFAKARAEL